MRGHRVHSGLVIIRSLHFTFVFSELCPLPRGLLPLPSLGVPHTSTPTPRSVEYSHGVPSPCNSHNGGSSPGLRVFHPSETLPLGLGPALPRTPPHGSPSPIARMTSPELSQGAQGPRSPLPPAPERGVPCQRLGVMRISTPGLGTNSQVPPLTGAARTCVFLHSPSTGATDPLPETSQAPPRVPERRHLENSAPPSDLVILRAIVDFGHSPCLQ